MSLTEKIFIIIAAIFVSCNQADNSVAKKDYESFTENSSCTDTIGSDIYKFLKVVIEKQNLDTTYGLEITPLEHIAAIETDSTFLQKHLLIDTLRKKARRKSNIIKIYGEIDSCLTQEDIQYMLDQKSRNINFRWSNKCVNLKNTNKFGEKYIFSVPVFSKDKTKFIITIENYRAGGIILLYKKENNDWISISEGQWIH